MIRNKKHAAGGLICVIGLVMILFGSLGHCATTSSVKHENSLGTVQYQDNPNTYLEGSITSAAYVGEGGHSGIVLRIQPRGTYALFTEDVLFCGEPADMFAGKSNPLILTYETKAHISVEGVGCHVLKSVDEVKTTHESF